jgi:hypothetical protein
VAIVVATQYGIRGGVFEMAAFACIATLVMLRAEKSRIRFTQVRLVCACVGVGAGATALRYLCLLLTTLLLP